MAATVKEIMNPELFSVRATNTVEEALNGILGLGITGAAVVDADGKPLGVVSMRDLVGRADGITVGQRMSAPPVVVRTDTRIAHAARIIGETGFRRLVVIDDAGVAVGMVSTLDVIRALAGIPSRHPPAFPHFDIKTQAAWTDEAMLDIDNVDLAPDGPGLVTLSYDTPGRPDMVVWVESSHNVRTRLLDLLSLPQESGELRGWLQHRKDLRFRAAAVSDAHQRERLAEVLRATLRKSSIPKVATPAEALR